MSSTGLPSRKLGYASRRAGSKPHNQPDPGAKARQVVGDEAGYDLYANMDGENLGYIRDMIKEKQRKKNHQRAKSSLPEAESQSYQQRNTHRQIGYDRQDRISESEPYQEETERYSEQKPSVQEQLRSAISQKYFQEQDIDKEDQIIRRSEEESHQMYTPEPNRDDFLNSLVGYIETLQKPQKNRGKISSMHVRKSQITKKDKQNSIDLQLNRDRMQILERKYKKQKEQSAILAKQLQKYKRLDQENKQQIVRLQQKVGLLIRDIERAKHKHQLDLQKIEDIRNFVLNNRKNDTFEVMEMLSPKLRRKQKTIRRQDSIDKLQSEYKEFVMHKDMHDFKRITDVGYYSKK